MPNRTDRKVYDKETPAPTYPERRIEPMPKVSECPQLIEWEKLLKAYSSSFHRVPAEPSAAAHVLRLLDVASVPTVQRGGDSYFPQELIKKRKREALAGSSLYKERKVQEAQEEAELEGEAAGDDAQDSKRARVGNKDENDDGTDPYDQTGLDDDEDVGDDDDDDYTRAQQFSDDEDADDNESDGDQGPTIYS